jgi:hypothetical protein
MDNNQYEPGIKVSDEEITHLNIIKNDFHGEWNYSILPKTKNDETELAIHSTLRN